jgi:hypothetical protein
MQQIAIIYPSIAMFLLSACLVFSLGLSRLVAIKQGSVNFRFYKRYDEGKEPDRLRLLTRHVQNHFEVPPLFHMGVLLCYVTNSVTTFAITVAWLFVALRCLHSVIHLSSNNVTYRFVCFASSLMVLVVLWLSILSSILSQTPAAL